MRFKTDENIHPELAGYLRENGHDALTVWDQGMRGRPDIDLAVVCQSEHRGLITSTWDSPTSARIRRSSSRDWLFFVSLIKAVEACWRFSPEC